jgi:hypothetical protein
VQRDLLVARSLYVAGAIGFALLAALRTRLRNNFDLETASTIVLPTALVAAVAAPRLIVPGGLAPAGTWGAAAVVVPIAAVLGYFVTNSLIAYVLTGYGGGGSLFGLVLVVASVFTVPVSLAGHFVIRLILSRSFKSPGGGS